jgi:hypothetical protein
MAIQEAEQNMAVSDKAAVWFSAKLSFPYTLSNISLFLAGRVGSAVSKVIIKEHILVIHLGVLLLLNCYALSYL